MRRIIFASRNVRVKEDSAKTETSFQKKDLSSSINSVSCEHSRFFLSPLKRTSSQKIRDYIESAKQDEVESRARLDN